MAIKTLSAKDGKARYRVCVEGKGNAAVKATCDTLDDVREYLAANGTWAYIAAGIQALEIHKERVAIHDRDVEHRPGSGETVKIFGELPNSRTYTRRTVGENPRMTD
jgi:hypothetical protein